MIDDAGVSRYELEKRFGAHVGSMVDGVTQMSTVLQLVRRRRRISNDADPYQDATFKENLLDLCFSVSDNVRRFSHRLNFTHLFLRGEYSFFEMCGPL